MFVCETSSHFSQAKRSSPQIVKLKSSAPDLPSKSWHLSQMGIMTSEGREVHSKSMKGFAKVGGTIHQPTENGITEQ